MDEEDKSDEKYYILKAQDGDLDAFSRLMEAHQPRLLSQAIAFCKDHELARDLVQETMLSAWNSLSNYDETCQLFTWLYIILLRQHQRSQRWFSRRIPSANPNQIEASIQYEKEHDEKSSNLGSDECDLVRMLISKLPQKHQKVIRLKYYAGATESEISHALGIAPGTVKSRLHNALLKLRRMKEKVNLYEQSGH